MVSTLVKFFGKMSAILCCDSAIKLGLGTLGDMTRIGTIAFVFHRPRQPRLVIWKNQSTELQIFLQKTSIFN
jgi:hypothetical protein